MLRSRHSGVDDESGGASATELWREVHTPFGERFLAPAANDNNMGFTGHIEDAATGLTYMQARFYDPVAARFLSIDPVGFAEGGPGYFNRYAYVHNDPVNATDPTGMCTGSRITNDDGTCASTGGFTTGSDGVAQGMAFRKLGQSISEAGDLNLSSSEQRDLGSAVSRSGATSVEITDISITVNRDDGPKYEPHSKKWERIASGRASPRAFESIPDRYREIRVRARVVQLCGGDRGYGMCGGGNVALWWRRRFVDAFGVSGGRFQSQTWTLGTDSYTGAGYSVRFDFVGTGEYDIDARY